MSDGDSLYRALLAASLDAILLTAPDGQILSANAAACRIFGCSEGELIRRGRAGVVDPADPRLGHRPYRAALGVDAALRQIEQNRDRLYDPRVVDTCISLFYEKGFNLDG